MYDAAVAPALRGNARSWQRQPSDLEKAFKKQAQDQGARFRALMGEYAGGHELQLINGGLIIDLLNFY